MGRRPALAKAAHALIKSCLPSRDEFYQAFLSPKRLLLIPLFIFILPHYYRGGRGRSGDEANETLKATWLNSEVVGSAQNTDHGLNHGPRPQLKRVTAMKNFMSRCLQWWLKILDLMVKVSGRYKH